MLRLTADVNGIIIGHVFIHNTGKVNEDGFHIYNAATSDPSGEMTIGIEGILHNRRSGWEPLAMIVLHKAGMEKVLARAGGVK